MCKTYNRISDLRKEISSLKKDIVAAEEAVVKTQDELNAAESKLALVDGEPVMGENPVRLKRLKSYAEKAKEQEESIRDSLEAKEALLARALEENEVWILSLEITFTSIEHGPTLRVSNLTPYLFPCADIISILIQKLLQYIDRTPSSGI